MILLVSLVTLLPRVFFKPYTVSLAVCYVWSLSHAKPVKSDAQAPNMRLLHVQIHGRSWM